MLTENDTSTLLLSCHPTTCSLDPIPSTLLQATAPTPTPAITQIIHTSLTNGTVRTTGPGYMWRITDLSLFFHFRLKPLNEESSTKSQACYLQIISMRSTSLASGEVFLQKLSFWWSLWTAKAFTQSVADFDKKSPYPPVCTRWIGHLWYSSWIYRSGWTLLAGASIQHSLPLHRCATGLRSQPRLHCPFTRLLLNLSKTVVLVFPATPSIQDSISINSGSSATVPTKYAWNLGVISDDQLSFDEHISISQACMQVCPLQ